jgi:hypothetical protein
MPEQQSISYRSGYKYQLAATYTHTLPAEFQPYLFNCEDEFLSIRNGCLVIAHGYAWDGPSGPTIDTKNFMRGSLVHDALYQLMRQGVIPRRCKDAADRELQRMCIEDGMSSIRAWWVLTGLEQFGAKATISNKNIMVAP